jgi:GT2 family glycosyltransferase
MAQLSFVTVCMGRLAFLRQTLGAMAAQPGAQCILVDWSCPDQCGDWAEQNHPGVRVLRLGGHTTINVAAARNAGAAEAQSEWIGFVDADVVLDAAFCATLVPQLQSGHFYRPAPERIGLSGTFLCLRADFLRAGSFDEVRRCYGDDDYDLYDALRFAGVQQAYYPAALVRHIDHGHELRTQRFAFTDHKLGVLINRIYRVVKWEVARLRGATLERVEREELYDQLWTRVPALVPRDSATGGFPLDGVLAFAEGEVRRLHGGQAVGGTEQRLRTAILKP